jgi:hypothetical protein
MRHFLLIYDHTKRALINQTEYSATSVDEATTDYQRAEADHGASDDIEIVLIGADSIETVWRTHGHYFSGDDAVERYLTRA